MNVQAIFSSHQSDRVSALTHQMSSPTEPVCGITDAEAQSPSLHGHLCIISKTANKTARSFHPFRTASVPNMHHQQNLSLTESSKRIGRAGTSRVFNDGVCSDKAAYPAAVAKLSSCGETVNYFSADLGGGGRLFTHDVAFCPSERIGISWS